MNDKTIAIKRTLSEVRAMPEFIRHIAETGSYTRTKAIELGILKPSDWGKLPEIEWIDKARGDGHRDFSCISQRSLHERFGATFLTWCVTTDQNGEILLKSSTWRENDEDYVYV